MVEGLLTGIVVIAGPLFVVYYLSSYRRLVRRRYAVSPQKTALLLTTCGVSVTAWSLLTSWKALVISLLPYWSDGFVWSVQKRED